MDRYTWNPEILNGKTILITGGTGSFGKMLLKCLLGVATPKKVIIFSRDEYKQFEMAQVYSPERYPFLRYFLGDVRDVDRLRMAFSGVDLVIHAAALKQVPAAEYNPFEAVKTNVLGSANVIQAAIETGVKKIVALSTDKAVNPANLYGATKLCSEKLFVAGNAYSTDDSTRFSIVRYGNVVGSRGSVIPLFQKQRHNKVVTVTDPRMTRFWVTLEDAVAFVMKRVEHMVGGEIFVPKIPTMGIMDLAKAVCPECEAKIVGIRPGEKLHEALITPDEARHTFEFDKHYMIKPVFNFFQRRGDVAEGTPVPDDFEYNSGTAPWRLGVEELRDMIDTLDTEG